MRGKRKEVGRAKARKSRGDVFTETRELVKEWMLAKGITQAALAELIGTTQQSVSLYLKGTYGLLKAPPGGTVGEVWARLVTLIEADGYRRS